MTDQGIFITQGGNAWHSRPDCEALATGQEKARQGGALTWPIREVSPGAIQQRLPCLVCVSPELDAFVRSAKASRLSGTETEYEERFLHDVLDGMPELDTWVVKVQPQVIIDDRTYRPDFSIVREGAGRIAVEIDGRDKGQSAPTLDQWSRRQNDLASAGWTVLRFTNRQVTFEQEECRRQLAAAVATMADQDAYDDVDVAADQTEASYAEETSYDRKRDPVVGWIVAVAVVVAISIVGVTIYALQSNAKSAASSGGIDPVRQANGFLLCPDDHPVKGNISATGDRIYWVKGSSLYDKTRPERCFVDAASAEQEGYRSPRT